VDQHRADRARSADGARERDAVARTEPDRLRAAVGVAAAPGDDDHHRCEPSEPTPHNPPSSVAPQTGHELVTFFLDGTRSASADRS
jgi:hypothetical protein